jgi:T5SS/PEP-CTERM-associated repeat protein
VSFSESTTNSQLEVENGSVAFDLNGQTYETTSSIGAAIGNVDGQTGRLTILDGRLDVDSANDSIRIGTSAGAVGQLTVGSGGLIGVEGNSASLNPVLYVGTEGSGALTIQDNGALFVNRIFLGEQIGSAGTAVVSGPLARMDGAVETIIGNRGIGEFAISNGANVVGSGPITLGSVAGSSGTLSITGLGSVWTNSDASIIVGKSGTGTLNVLTGGELITKSATIAGELGSTGAATISGAGSSWNSGTFGVGSKGVGTLMINNGGQVVSFHSTVGGVQVGGPNGDGNVIVTGAGSKWTIGPTQATLNIATFGKGEVSVLDGARVVGSGTVGAGILGNSTANGSVLVQGNGSTWEGSLTVGDYGTGTLKIEDGARMRGFNATAAWLTLGRQLGSSGIAIVEGIGSTIDISDLTVGYDGSGTLTIQNGGTVYSNGEHGYDDTHIGSQPQAHGAVTVDGPSSSWTNRSEIAVGYRGTGSLTIQNGGKVTSRDGYIAAETGSIGSVTISGAGSTWTNQGGYGFAGGSVDVGHRGNGSLVITNGGQVSGIHGSIGSGFGNPNGSATIDGVGSIWHTLLNLAIGNGVLVISNGGEVSVGETLFVRANGEIKGNSIISGNVSNGGKVAPGTSSGSGTLHVVGNYTQETAGTLDIELASDTSFDILNVSEQIALNGILRVSVVDNYSPSIGDEFDILDWGSLSGTFSSLQLPSLPVGLSWNTPQLYAVGELAVITTPTGDYNQNGIVDAADYTVWRNTLGQTGTGLLADGNSNDEIDTGDYGMWKQHFGETAGGGSAGASPSHVPEPASSMLLVLAALALTPTLSRNAREKARRRGSLISSRGVLGGFTVEPIPLE